MFRGGNWWRGVVKLASALAVLGAVVPAAAQSPLPAVDPATVALLAFRPGSNDTLLLATTDAQARLQIHLVRLVAEGKPVLVRTLPGTFSAAAWLDEAHIITSGGDGKLESWPLVGESPALLAMLPEPLRPDGNHVFFEWMKMPDSTGFGDYQESGIGIAATFNGTPVQYTAQMYLDDEPPTTALRAPYVPRPNCTCAVSPCT